jgi:coenzyme F420-reducing hydrogenase gamma subunit
MSKPTVGIFGLTGCAGDQLVILNCEDRLLDLVSLLDFRDFLMASSDNDEQCELDLALVEGAVMSRRDELLLKRVRERARTLVAIGTCAVWGGVAATDGNGRRAALLREVYGPLGATYDSLPARPLHDFVKVDVHLTGCPIEKEQFLSAVANLLNGDIPLLPQYAVCVECKFRENNCLLLEKGEICCGPLTVAGCNARCPALRIPCVGCRGPADDANLASAMAVFGETGVSREDIIRKLGMFAPEGVRS